MKDNENFSTIGEILGSSFEKKAEYSHASKIATFFSFWSDIVGKKFAKSSKPYSCKFGKLYVVCENSFVLQELVLYKNKLLRKITPYAQGVGLNIQDLIFTYKNWKVQNISYGENEEENFEIDPNEVELSEEDMTQIAIMVDGLSFLNSTQKEKYYNDIVNNFKVNILRKHL